MLFTLFETVKPDAVLVALDAPGKTFRHAEYAEYKGTRREIPQELISQLDGSRDLIKCFGIPMLEEVGYEADDVVGTVSREAEENGYETTIVTGDLDSLQLVDPWVTVMTTKRGVTDVVMYDPEAVRERYGFGPEFVPDYKALVGDTSDNIPGVPGIGDKSASILIQEFGSIENILERIEDVPEKFRKKIVGNEDQMKKSKWLATIVRDAPIKFEFTPFRVTPDQLNHCKEFLSGYEFRSHARKADQIFASYMEGSSDIASEGIAAEVSVGTESITVQSVTGKDTFDQMVSWIGSQPFSVVFHEGSSQKSMFEDNESRAFVAVGTQVSECGEQLALSIIQKFPSQFAALDTKISYRKIGGIEDRPFFDAMLASYVLQSGRSSYDLNDLVTGYLDVKASGPQELAVGLLMLEPVMRERLKLEGQLTVFEDMELALVPILAEMERAGIRVSVNELTEFSKLLQVEVEKVQSQAWETAGGEFNLGSPKQIGELLFEKMGLPGGKKTKTGWATGVEILGELAGDHEIAAMILSYRELTKLRSTYAEALPKMVADDGRIHTTFNQAVAATGRLSSIDPNLQNIPVRTELGRTIRKAFIAKDGCQLGSFDYSQIELRILAHMCQDENLVTAFQTGVDVHSVTASLMFDQGIEQVTKEQRRLAKMLNYAVLYGVTGFGLANQLGAGFSVEDASRLIKQYNERFPAVKAFTDGMVDEARSKGFTTTLSGRRRYFPDIHAGNRIARAYAERQAMNAPIQGTAADMIKLAMLDVANTIKGTSTTMLLQVHDELVFESSDQFSGLVKPIAEKMESALPLSVPVEVDSKFGSNWMEMTPTV